MGVCMVSVVVVGNLNEMAKSMPSLRKYCEFIPLGSSLLWKTASRSNEGGGLAEG